MTTPKSLALALAAVLTSHQAEAAVLAVDCVAGPFTDIQSAVTAATPGDSVVVSPCAGGAYAPFRVDMKDNLQIVGADRQFPSEVGAVTAGTGVSPAAYAPLVVVDGRLDPTVPCADIIHSIGVTVQQLSMRDCGTHGVSVVASGNVYLQGNRITQADGDGIHIADVAGPVHVINNLLGRNRGNGIFAQQLIDSIVTDNMIGRNMAAGILVPTRQSEDNQYFNNTIVGHAAACIEVGGTNEKVMRNTCGGNALAFGAAEIRIGPTAVDVAVIGNDTGGAASIADLSGTADIAQNR